MVLAVSDFLATSQVAWLLCRDCFTLARGAPQEFKLLAEELKTLHVIMKLFKDEFKNPDSALVRGGEGRQNMIGEILAKVNESLNTLNDTFRKHRDRAGDSSLSGFKLTWDKFKWAWDMKEVDGLRSKLSYHNGILGLLLACAGNSSLERIQITTKSIDEGLEELNKYFQRAMEGTLQPTSTANAPLTSAPTLDNSARLNFSAQCMKAAEVSQSWHTIGINDWIQVGRQWLHRANTELAFRNPSTGPNVENTVFHEGYLNLLKASWILTNIIAVYPGFALIEYSTQHEVMQFTQAINQEFKRVEALDMKFLTFSAPNKVVIWEEDGSRNWIMEDEMIVYGSSGNYQPQDHTGSQKVCISVVVNSVSNQARFVLHDESWKPLLQIHVLELFAPDINEIDVKNTTISIAKQKLVLCTRRDVLLLHATLVLYGKYNLILTGLPDPALLYHDAFIFLIALKMSQIEDPAMPRNLAQMRRYQQLPPNTQHGAHPLLYQFNMIVNRLSHGLPSNKPRVKGANIQKYAYSLLGWVLYQYPDIGMEWLQIHLKSQRLDTHTSQEDALLPPAAVTEGNYELLKLWLDTGLDLKMEQDLLPSACRGGNPLIIQLLLDHGASINIPVSGNMTAIQYAAQVGQGAVVKMLIDRGAKVDCQGMEGQTNRQPLHLASEAGHEGIVKLLLDHGAQIECRQKDQWTPLHLASGAGHESVVRLLLDRGAKSECCGKDLGRPLHFASEAGHESIVRLLLDRGAQIECQQTNQGSPLHLAAAAGHENIVRLLLDRGAKIECQDEERLRPLHVASYYGHDGIVRLLLDRRAEIECQNTDKWRPLHIASWHGHQGIVRLLLDHRAEIECQEEKQQTPLHLASDAGHENIVSLLLDRGARVECRDGNQKTPLHVASDAGHEDIVRLLLDRGAGWSSPTMLQTLNGHYNWVNAVAFSPDGKLLASGSNDNTIGLWETSTGKQCSVIVGHSNHVLTVAFSPDGKLLASGSRDNTIRLWETSTGKQCSVIEGHSHFVFAVAFSPDGKLLASGSFDTTVKLWGPSTN